MVRRQQGQGAAVPDRGLGDVASGCHLVKVAGEPDGGLIAHVLRGSRGVEVDKGNGSLQLPVKDGEQRLSRGNSSGRRLSAAQRQFQQW